LDLLNYYKTMLGLEKSCPCQCDCPGWSSYLYHCCKLFGLVWEEIEARAR
jgi:hypothetical protein